MSNDSTVTVSQAQAQLPKLLKKDSFAISRHGKVIGIYLSRDRIEALIETMELLGDPGFTKALKEHKAGKMRFVDLEDVRW
jgi:PHD/YefM family antitoxin component YafN of YafNO toxin-antitoxin module